MQQRGDVRVSWRGRRLGVGQDDDGQVIGVGVGIGLGLGSVGGAW